MEVVRNCFAIIGKQPVWPYLVKIQHLGKILKVFWQILEGLFSILQNIEPNLATIYALDNVHMPFGVCQARKG